MWSRAIPDLFLGPYTEHILALLESNRSNHSDLKRVQKFKFNQLKGYLKFQKYQNFKNNERYV